MFDRKQTILILDDDSAMRGETAAAIRSAVSSAVVIESGSASEAFFKIDKQIFDLLIADVKKPKMEGANLIRKLSSLQPSQRPGQVMVTSGDCSVAEVVEELGDVPFMPKPLDKTDLLKHLNQLLGRASAATPAAVQATAPKVDAAFIDPFIQAALEVLKLTAQTVAEKDKVFIRDKDQTSGDISAVIAMNSETYLGSMSISFEKATFLAVLQGMLGEPYTEITPENQDACSELCNQIFGMAKKELNQKGHTIQSAIPSVVVGPAHKIKHSAKGPCIAVRFKTAQGLFTIEAVVGPRVSN